MSSTTTQLSWDLYASSNIYHHKAKSRGKVIHGGQGEMFGVSRLETVLESVRRSLKDEEAFISSIYGGERFYS